MDIGIVITLLFLLISVAGPLIEKQLKKAGKIEQARTLRKITDTISGDVRDGKADTSSTDVTDVTDVSQIPTGTYVQTVSDTNVSEAVPVTDPGHDDENMPDARAEALSKALERYIARKEAKAMGPGAVSRMKTRPKVPAQTGDLPAGKKKLDIDPRKLVIYSEIMKPKF